MNRFNAGISSLTEALFHIECEFDFVTFGSAVPCSASRKVHSQTPLSPLDKDNGVLF